MNDQSSPGQRRSLTARQEFLESWKIGRNGEGAQPHDLGIYPYPGLRSFRPNEADLFYGRDSQIKELRDLLADHNIIVVLGGSGSGKSVLLRSVIGLQQPAAGRIEVLGQDMAEPTGRIV